ncbi:glycine-rich domain-containing protein [Streptomyces sp. URMC 129]|uniref:glycine-rich domain-containing protein n=1 Tax=Streptomyces sp. URMC 129 TaxID=3423407 RepID=UPI003F19647E
MPDAAAAPPTAFLDPRTLLTVPVFARLVDRILRENPEFSHDFAERIVDQTTAFVVAAARSREPLSPSGVVDIGWHSFILHTRDYADFCQRVAGAFVHHAPTDPAVRAATPHSSIAARRERTLDAVRRAGFSVDEELWPAAPADCTQCYCGCGNSPNKP